jgi:uncharacterized protein YhaN
MRFKDIYIDGFGIFNDLYVDDISNGLLVFGGNNEAGKTTLMSFIRAILYGFPRDIATNNRHEPLNGGNHGGTLTFIDQNGSEYRIERKEGSKSAGEVVVYGPGGRQKGEESLNILLKGVSRNLYNNLFCFGLDELQRLETLQKDEVNNFIYSAGMGTGSRSIVEVRQELLDREEELYTPRGRTRPTANNLLGEIDEVEDELNELMELPEEYNNYQQQVEELQQEIADDQRELDLILEDINWLQKIKDGLEPWNNIKLIKRELKELVMIDSFPEAGIDRLEELEAAIEECIGDKKKLENEIKQKKVEVKAIDIDESILENSTKIIDLNEKKEVYLKQLDEMNNLQNDLKHAKEACEVGLTQLGSNWSEAKIKEFDFSIKFKAQIREYRQELKSIEREFNNIETKLEIQENRLKEENIELTSIRKKIEKLKGENISAEVLEEQRVKLNRLKELKMEMQDLNRRIDVKMEEKKELNNDLEEIIEEIDNREANNTLDWKKRIFNIALIGSSIFSFWQEETLTGVILGIIAIFFIFLGNKFIMNAEEKDYFRKQKEILKTKLNKLEEEFKSLELKLSNFKEETGKMINKDQITGVDIQKEEEYLQEKKDKKNSLEFLKNEYEEKKKLYKRRENKYKSIEEEHKELKQERESLNSSWNELLNEHKLAEDINPDNLLDIIREAEKSKENIRDKEKIRDRISDLKAEIDQYQEEVNNLIKECELELNGDVEYKITKLNNNLDEDKENKRKKEELGNKLDELRLEIRKLDEKIKTKINKKEVMLEKGQAQDEEEFRSNAIYYQQRKELLENLRENKVKIDALIKKKDNQEQLLNDLGGYDSIKIKEEKEKLENQQEELKLEIANKQEKLGELRERISTLESAEERAQMRNKKEILLTRLEESGEDWATYAICSRLLDMAKEKYEEERQPAVLKRASNYFKTMTKGNYKRIFKPLDEEKFEIEKHNGKRLNTGALSKGTAEQLYLAMRISFAREYAKQVIPLPLIMDDILVNFDSQRLKSTLEVIAQVAKKQQIIFFTCHNHMVEIMDEVVKDYEYYRLDSGKVIESSVSA